MAAYAALVSLMHIIDDLQNHHSPPISLDIQQVQSLTQNVMFLQEFLEGFFSPVADGDEADPLEMRIADAAYAAEDVIESHIVNNIQPISLHQFLWRSKESKNVSSSADANCNDETIRLYQDLQKVIEEMDLIKKEAMKIDTKKVVIHDQRHQFVPTNASLRPSSSSTRKNNSSVVLSDDVVHGIMEKLVADQPHRLAIPIVGMGGIGKTTLAKTVYSKPLIKEHFDICAWATISQQYDTRELLCEIHSQATETDKKELSKKSEDKLGLELYQYLYGRRFLIVLDDMWSVDAWDKIQLFLPNDNKGSRVIVTTRLWQLSSQLNNNYSHQMEFLDEANSWVLFSKTVFGENDCPPELEETGKKIVENCKGLPLSIVVVGGILRNMEHNKGYWESIGKNLTSVVNLENDQHCLRMLKLSYNHLPVYLKPCFLYMGVFDEDEAINVSTLVKLWVCEGFLKPIDGKSLVTVAKEFLKDLVDRNLILTNQLGYTGNIKWVKVHDLLRDLCLNEVKKEGFYHVIGQCSSGGISRQRRAVIRRNTLEVDYELHSMSHVRSIFCENGIVPMKCGNLGLLRTFHARKKYSSFTGKSYMSDCFELKNVNLQHLAVRVNSIASIFTSLGLLWNLHTLIVCCIHNSTAPSEIWRMLQLRHIEFVFSRVCLPDPPSDGVIMENLHVLTGVENFECREEVVKRIPNIKKLGVHNVWTKGIDNIECLSKLESLYISYSSNPHVFPRSLKSLTIKEGYKCEEVLEKIGWLPLLEKLKLWTGCFGTGKWEVVEDQFPSLKYLELATCNSLEEWTAEASSIFPCLQELYLYKLEGLKEIPSQIGDIPTLQKISLIKCSEAAVICAKGIVEEQMELQGDQLPFHVQVLLPKKNEALQSLADPNFEVSVA